MNSFVGFLRGVNVGGKSLLKMSQLCESLTAAGMIDVRSYIQSGNILFSSPQSDTQKLARQVKAIIEKQHKLTVEVVVISNTDWRQIVKTAPNWWGRDPAWKHNLLILIPPYSMAEVVVAIGDLKPDIEMLEAGDGVIYQSMSLNQFGQTTTGKLAKSPVYKKLTIRNYNTVTKILALLN